MSAPGADPFAAIRQRFVSRSQVRRLIMLDAGRVHDDICDLLKQWDTRESALRALVAQWKQEAVIADATCNDTIAVQLHECADAVERLLESEP